MLFLSQIMLFFCIIFGFPLLIIFILHNFAYAKEKGTDEPHTLYTQPCNAMRHLSCSNEVTILTRIQNHGYLRTAYKGI